MLNKHMTTDNLRTILPPIQYLIDQKAEGLDWNENDPSAKGYIKNRPFYEEKKIIDIVPKTTMIFDGNWAFIEGKFPSLANGEIYTVIFDGDRYDCKATNVVDGHYTWYELGNVSIVNEDGKNTGEPFFITISHLYFECCISIEEYWECDIEIFGPSVTIHKIPEKYLPKMETIGIKGEGENAEVFNGGEASQASGEYSHAEGFCTTASGSRSHAEGDGASATENGSHAEGMGTTASEWGAHSEGIGTVASGQSSHAEGWNTIASGNYAHAEGSSTQANSMHAHAEGLSSAAYGSASHAEGNSTLASGSYSHAEGNMTTASGSGSHAEGDYAIAAGGYSHAEGGYTRTGKNQTRDTDSLTSLIDVFQHAEGYATLATGIASHAEGQCTTASGRSSHVEGEFTTASAYASHAEGTRTVANSKSQHVQGEYNILDIVPEFPAARGTYAHIVGNGYVTSDAIVRSNAHTLDWNGLGWFAGGLKVGGTGQDDEAAVEVATKEYVDARIDAMLGVIENGTY